ncbi:hypothetical protein NEOKW01_1846 [Nematocida sp. AWRm80]|nr:hypothetical protein NEOKW01_1846 [Nematocida sp. AWRm80]
MDKRTKVKLKSKKGTNKGEEIDRNRKGSMIKPVSVLTPHMSPQISPRPEKKSALKALSKPLPKRTKEEITLDNVRSEEELGIALDTISLAEEKIKKAQKTKQSKRWTPKEYEEYSKSAKEIEEQMVLSPNGTWEDYPTKNMPVLMKDIARLKISNQRPVPAQNKNKQAQDKNKFAASQKPIVRGFLTKDGYDHAAIRKHIEETHPSNITREMFNKAGRERMQKDKEEGRLKQKTGPKKDFVPIKKSVPQPQTKASNQSQTLPQKHSGKVNEPEHHGKTSHPPLKIDHRPDYFTQSVPEEINQKDHSKPKNPNQKQQRPDHQGSTRKSYSTTANSHPVQKPAPIKHRSKSVQEASRTYDASKRVSIYSPQARSVHPSKTNLFLRSSIPNKTSTSKVVANNLPGHRSIIQSNNGVLQIGRDYPVKYQEIHQSKKTFKKDPELSRVRPGVKERVAMNEKAKEYRIPSTQHPMKKLPKQE